ncbi:hypothetical protein CKJ89_39470, partial [Klebsiella pneumoniae]
ALIGLSLSGVAAVGMTYLSEEIHPSFAAFSMGLYISALIGLSLSGVAAVGMTYLSEEIHPSFAAFSMG